MVHYGNWQAESERLLFDHSAGTSEGQGRGSTERRSVTLLAEALRWQPAGGRGVGGEMALCCTGRRSIIRSGPYRSRQGKTCRAVTPACPHTLPIFALSAQASSHVVSLARERS